MMGTTLFGRKTNHKKKTEKQKNRGEITDFSFVSNKICQTKLLKDKKMLA